MEDECLSLTWNNHAATYRKTLSALREENMLIDVTLACDGKKFPAHKLVLVTCSDYFRDILGDIACAHPIIYMRGVAAKELQALIDFMYTGQTDVPQSEVPNLLSTAEALQIKGLGVLEGKTNTSLKKDKVDSSHRKPHPESAKEVNGTDNHDARRKVLNNCHSNKDEGQDNLYNNHYALSSPKRRKTEERSSIQSPEYKRSYSDNDKPSSSENPSSTIENLPRKYPPLATSTAATLLSDLFQQNQTFNTSSKSHSTPSSTQSSSLRTTAAAQNYAYNRGHESVAGSGSSPSPGVRPLPSFQPGNQKQGPSSPETNSASPRALNYSLSGLGRDDFLTGGSLSHLLDDTSVGMADTPEKLLKSEIKEEALDFSSNTISADSPSFNDSTVEEETRLYLDAFTRSAGLSPTLPSLEKPLVVATTGGTTERPFVCPICQKCFAKGAILKRHHLAHFRPYVCHLCTRSFTRREVLAEHLLEHNGADLRLPCPVCNMTIKRKRNLQAHIKVKHPEYHLQSVANRKTKTLC